MKRHRSVVPGTFLAVIILLSLIGTSSCDYARMREQESVRTYEKEMPRMDSRTVPAGDSFQALVSADPKAIKNPAPYNEETVKRGRVAYTYFCIQCHGRRADGMGTVGQSFSPLPTDLASSRVLNQTDGELYAKIRLGYLRHPQLYTTISESDTWAVINYSRSLARKK